jgi:hypothetical protein
MLTEERNPHNRHVCSKAHQVKRGRRGQGLVIGLVRCYIKLSLQIPFA